MAKNSYLDFTYSTSTGAQTAQQFAGGRVVVINNGVFAASTTLKLEISLDGGTTYTDVYDILGNAITQTVSGASGEAYFTADIPPGLLRTNVTAGTMTSGNTYVSVVQGI